MEASGDDGEIFGGVGGDERASDVRGAARDARDVGVRQIEPGRTCGKEHGRHRAMRGEPGLDHELHASRGAVDAGERLEQLELIGSAVDGVAEIEREVPELARR